MPESIEGNPLNLTDLRQVIQEQIDAGKTLDLYRHTEGELTAIGKRIVGEDDSACEVAIRWSRETVNRIGLFKPFFRANGSDDYHNAVRESVQSLDRFLNQLEYLDHYLNHFRILDSKMSQILDILKSN